MMFFGMWFTTTETTFKTPPNWEINASSHGQDHKNLQISGWHVAHGLQGMLIPYNFKFHLDLD